MTIGAAWNIEDPAKPWALFDTDADIKIPIGIADWLTDLGTTYQSHTIIATSPLECAASSHSAGVLTVRMRVAAGATFTAGSKYPFTVRVQGADGTTKDDRTFWLLLKSR